MSLSLLYTRRTTAPAIALPEKALPTQRVFSAGHSYPAGTMADSEDGVGAGGDGELHPSSFQLWFPSMTSPATAHSLTGCLCTGARALG